MLCITACRSCCAAQPLISAEIRSPEPLAARINMQCHPSITRHADLSRLSTIAMCPSTVSKRVSRDHGDESASLCPSRYQLRQHKLGGTVFFGQYCEVPTTEQRLCTAVIPRPEIYRSAELSDSSRKLSSTSQRLVEVGSNRLRLASTSLRGRSELTAGGYQQSRRINKPRHT